MEGNYQREECTGMKTLLMEMSGNMAEEELVTVAGTNWPKYFNLAMSEVESNKLLSLNQTYDLAR
jgi:hypothetical protein